MDARENKQIFYDPTNKRWFRVKFSFYLIVIPLILILTLFIIRVVYEAQQITTVTWVKLPVPAMMLHSSIPSITLTTKQHTLYKFTPFNSPVDPHYHAKTIAFLGNDSVVPNSITENLAHIDMIIGQWLHLENNTVSENDQESETLEVDTITASKQKVAIIPALETSANDAPMMMANILSQTSARQRLIHALLNYVSSHKFNGININFNISLQNRDNFSNFIQELSASFTRNKLSVFVTVPADNAAYDYKMLAQNATYVILKTHDQHQAESQPGPLSSLPWFHKILQQRLLQIPREKLIIGMGNTGYDWVSQEKAKTRSFSQIMRTAKTVSADISFDPESFNPTFSYIDHNGKIHIIWFLDAVTVFNQLSLAYSLHPYGFAIWSSGQEDAGIWTVLNNINKQPFNQNVPIQLSLVNITGGLAPDVRNVISITGKKKSGKRVIVFDKNNRLITHENYQTLPVSYQIEYYGNDLYSKKVALTFDDGPNPPYTNKILDILKATNTPATFFVIGRNALMHPGLLKREMAEGHEIGNHTFTHPNISEISNFQTKLEAMLTQQLIESIINRKSFIFRPPYGLDAPPETLYEAKPLVTLSKLGYLTVLMNVDPSDWAMPGVDKIVNGVLEGMNEQSNIIVLHDGGGHTRQQTVDALPRIIAGLKAQGYQFVRLSQFLDTAQVTLMQPMSASWYLWLAKISFEVLRIFFNAIYYLFFGGLILGIFRFVVLSILAIYQKYFGKSYPPVVPNQFSVSVIIPACNEEKVVVQTINALLNARQPADFNIIVVNDGSTDNSLHVLQDNFANNPKIKIVNQANSGKTTALNTGLSHTTSDIIIILDADTVVTESTVMNLLAPFIDPKVGAVAGNIKVGNQMNILTRWQALEYITSQNLDRRALRVLHSIAVVPGATGAWRRSAIIEAGGFTRDTLAEDCDLTIKIRKLGYVIEFANHAVSFTEAPNNFRSFIRQRFRWIFGTMQVMWKHKKTLFNVRYPSLGFVILPNTIIYQIVIPFMTPFLDIVFLFALTMILIDWQFHPSVEASLSFTQFIYGYLIFTLADVLNAVLAFVLDGEKNRKLLWEILPQRVVYRQLIYFICLKTTISVLKGKEAWWGKIIRQASVSVEA